MSKLILALVDHPNVDVLLIPVLRELVDRGHRVRALVVNEGRSDRLEAAGLATTGSEEALQDFLDAAGPRLLINAADMIPQHHLGIQVDNLCRQHGVPTLTLEHAPFALAYDGAFPPHVAFGADMMAVIGDEDRRQYEALGIAPERLTVTGSPAFDPIMAATGATSPSPSQDIVIFGQAHTWVGPHSCQGVEGGLWVAELENLYRLLAQRFPAARIRIKPHPAEPHFGTDRLYSQGVPAELNGKVEVVGTESDNVELMAGAALVVSFSSTIWLESRILGRPCVFFSLQERSGRLAEDVARMGGLWIAGRGIDFAARLEPHLTELAAQADAPAAPPPDLLQAYAGPGDGSAAGRVADAAETLLAEGSPEVPMPVVVFDRTGRHPRYLLAGETYARYVHLEALADEVMKLGPGQPEILVVEAADTRLGNHLPLAYLDRHVDDVVAGLPLPHPDDSFDVVAAPDLWQRVLPADRGAVLTELLRVSRSRVVLSTPSPAGQLQLEEVGRLLGHTDLADAWQDEAPDPQEIMDLYKAAELKVGTRHCHNPASWSQSILLENLGLDQDSLAAVRTSLQATAYPNEHQGFGVRVIHSVSRS